MLKRVVNQDGIKLPADYERAGFPSNAAVSGIGRGSAQTELVLWSLLVGLPSSVHGELSSDRQPDQLLQRDTVMDPEKWRDQPRA
jgi:hypothetical protein